MRVIKRENTFYFQHSFRKEGKVLTREQYLGNTLPEDVEKRKSEFLRACRKEGFFDTFEKIRKKHAEEWKRLPPSAREKRIQQLSIDFTYNTNAIEGSTITLDETREIIEHKIAPHKPLNDIKETERHAELFTKIVTEEIQLTQKVLLKWHRSLFRETKPDMAGTIRDYGVRVGPYVAPDWQDLDKLLKELFTYYEKNNIIHPVELAARLHYRFEKIHPFGDGNGRVGRLFMNAILWRNNYPVLVIEYRNRKSYYKALNKDEESFVQYFIRRYLKAHEKLWKK